MQQQPPKNLRRALGLGLALLTLVGAATGAQARPRSIWQPAQEGSGVMYGEPTNGEAWYPAIACTGGHLTIDLNVSDRTFPTRLRHDDYVDSRGRRGPWPVRVTISAAGVSSGVFAGTIDHEFEGFTMAHVNVPASSPVATAIATGGRIDARVLGEATHLPPIPGRLISRLSACLPRR